jgi:hypothetical protein
MSWVRLFYKRQNPVKNHHENAWNRARQQVDPSRARQQADGAVGAVGAAIVQMMFLRIICVAKSARFRPSS